PIRSYAIRHYLTLTFCAAAAIAFLAAGLSPVSGSKGDPVSPRGNDSIQTLTSQTALTNASNPFVTSARSPRDLGSDAFKLPLRTASVVSPFAASLTATKTDNVSTPVNPGDTIMYTVTITNTGTVPLTNVNFTDTLDANTTLVPGSVAVAPIAVNDSYNTIGNVNIQVPVGQGVIANDLNPHGS